MTHTTERKHIICNAHNMQCNARCNAYYIPYSITRSVHTKEVMQYDFSGYLEETSDGSRAGSRRRRPSPTPGGDLLPLSFKPPFLILQKKISKGQMADFFQFLLPFNAGCPPCSFHHPLLPCSFHTPPPKMESGSATGTNNRIWC